MKKIYLFCALVGLMSFMVVQTAQATTAPEEKLRQMAEREMTALKAEAKANGARIETKGALTVTPKDNYYQLELPFMTSYSPKGERIDIGTIKMNIAQGQSDDEWKASLALPTPMTFYDAMGQNLGQMHIGDQRCSFIWREDLLMTPKLDAFFQNIRFVSQQVAQNMLTLDQLEIQFDLEAEQKTGYWSGPYQFEINGVNANFINNKFKLGRLFSYGQYQGADFSKLKRLKELALEASATENKQAQDKALKDMIEMWTVPFDGLSGQGGVEGLEIVSTAEDGQVKKAHLQSLVTSYKISEMRSPSATAQSKFQFQGLVANDFMIPSLAAMIPERGQFEVKMQDIPASVLLNIFKDKALVMGGVSAPQTNAEAKALKPMQIMITDSFFKAPKLTTEMNGLFQYQIDPTKLSLPYGAFTLSFKGLDEMITALQNDQNAVAQSAFMTLSTLRLMGQEKQNSQGEKIRSFEFKIDEAGNATLNGAPIGGLIGGLLGAMGTSLPAPTTPSP